MNAEFFALAFLSALNPKLLALDLLLIENRRPRLMFSCLLLGGLTVATVIGLLDVLVFHADAIKSQGTVSAGVDLALGLVLLTAGALLATGRLHRRRKVPAPAAGGPPEQPGKKDSWAQRALSEPRFGLAMLTGAVIGIPGATYLTALHTLVTGHPPLRPRSSPSWSSSSSTSCSSSSRSRSWNCGPRPPKPTSSTPRTGC
jgi:hypothetical protein